ncbi:ABC transporter ATP-binding protein, partial [Halorubrum sp. SD612]|uniref:ABC transporter ATP-binding protein n=1 Tax=Halorubrum sp. SD612 TaxID=1855863 RepID=UPI000A2EA685
MARVTLDTLRKEFDRGTIVAVNDLDLEIDDGEFVTVVGPSGCGKTTTLRMVAGLEEPTSGTVSFDDDDVTDIHAKERPVAMVFQNYALYPHKTVRENMAFGLKMSTDMAKEERHERVREMAEMMGIEDLLDDKPDELSGGQKQRVALGRAIAREPEVFLFDEPLSNLDAKLRTEMRAEIQKLQKEFGVTAMYVTHDQEEAMTMGDRLAILNDGELQQVGEPTEVYQNPVNEFVAGFIGSPSMNFVDVDVETDGSGATVRNEDAGFELDLSAEYVRGHDLRNGRYTLGIRPENIVLDESPTGGENLRSTVEVVEPIGSDNYVH